MAILEADASGEGFVTPAFQNVIMSLTSYPTVACLFLTVAVGRAPFSLFIHFSMLRLPTGITSGLNLFAPTYLVSLSLDGE